MKYFICEVLREKRYGDEQTRPQLIKWAASDPKITRQFSLVAPVISKLNKKSHISLSLLVVGWASVAEAH